VDRLDLVENPASASELQTEKTEDAPATRKPFVVPEISVPVDVLEATTFFQGATSGAAN
jgi:hypothetical protein